MAQWAKVWTFEVRLENLLYLQVYIYVFFIGFRL